MQHGSVNHRLKEYVRGNVQTNNIECFWSVLKRTIGGTYIHVNLAIWTAIWQSRCFGLTSARTRTTRALLGDKAGGREAPDVQATSPRVTRLDGTRGAGV